ncbi:T9SS C-terminal target domain-containing protein [Lutibacter sp. HS1-25]|uniref:proprotein convertase P-domain-containing protein n=1 Tax=Lutibacter sp. HS1-25 TaxID=2485000 RepID=UPI0010136D30|nr:proprotein convertase P-domain-containing protein [Lutibacter sp. HS1-25]RXP64447.1 T9SS C-terminal target domain-containing protein [Lutibacter sp. HS1-25]
MKNKFPQFLLVLFIAVLTTTFFYFQNEKNTNNLTEIIKLRQQYQNYLDNSPFKKTLQLSKAERKALGIPPNKYYEREWELTMNPATGFPEPNKVLDIQNKRNSIKNRAPGDGDVTNNWVDRGPNNVGGRTRVILFDPNDADKNRVFAAGVSGGLWVNEDITKNTSWTLVDGVPGNMNISCITVDPNNSQIWYLGTGEQYTFGAAVGNGVYKTTNGGANWVNVPVQLAGGVTSGSNFAGLYFINDIIAWDNAGSTVLFLGVGSHIYNDASSPSNWLGYQNAGLYTSTNNGENWIRLENEDLKLDANSSYFTIPNDFEIGADNTLWMGSIETYGTGKGRGKVFKSSNGVDWSLVTTLASSNRVELAVSSTNKDKLYALTQGTTSSDPPHIYATTDAFATVIELAKPDAADTDINSSDFTRGQAHYNLMIEVDPTNDQIFYVGGIDLFRTTQGIDITSATDWEQISKWSNNNNMATLTCSKVHADQHVFTFRPNKNNEAVIGCDGGVYYASDLANAKNNDVFSVRNKNYNVTQFYAGSYGQDPLNELILAGAQDNGTPFIKAAIPGANSSIDITGGDGAYSVIDKDGDYMIVSYIYNEHYYYKLPYNGTFEYEIDSGSPQQGDFINQAGLDHNLNIMYSNGGSGKINRYILGIDAVVKKQLSDPLFTGSATAFKVSPYTTTSTTLLVGTDSSKLFKITNANNSGVGSIGWTQFTVPFVGSVSDIEFGTTENEIYVTMHNYGVTSVWYTADGGVTWENKEGNLPDMPVKCILPNPLVANEVIIGTELGVWSTKNFNDASPTWVSSYNGMRDVKVVDLDLRTADNSILATTHGRGVFTGKFLAAEFSISTENEVVTTCASTAIFNLDFNTYPSYNTKTTFTATNFPAGVTVNFSPTSLNAAGSFTMEVSNISLPIGEYPITIEGSGLGTYTANIILKVVDPSTINTVMPTAPLNEATAVEIDNVDFTWDAIAMATSYNFEISTNAGFTSTVETANVKNNNYTLKSVLNPGTVYYWRVNAVNSCVTGIFSEVQSFQTAINCNVFSNNTAIAIPDGLGANVDGLPAISVINVPSNILISDLNITLNITHTYPGDLKIMLKSPSNTEIILYQYNCGDEDNILVNFDDAGSTTYNCGSFIQTTVKPVQALSGFAGENAQGNWTLKIVDNYNGDVGNLNYWSIEVCENKTVTASNLVNNPITVGTNSSYIITNNDLKAESIGSTTSQQVFMLTQLPAVGILKLNGNALLVGETFSQADIDANLLSYVNSSFTSTADSFKVDITNATGGFLPNQQVDITIDSALNLSDDFLTKAGILIYPTVSNGYFSIASTKAIGKTTVELFAVSGQKVFSEKLDFSFGNVSHIGASQLAPGVYVLKLTSEEIVGTKKIVIK